jgi:hypothetical protein
MKKLMAVSAFALSFGAAMAMADTMSGYVSESHCGAKHSEVSDANTKCVNACLKGGSDPVLVSDGKVYKFDSASKDKAKAMAGQKVTVDGSLSGDTVTVNSITAAGQ